MMESVSRSILVHRIWQNTHNLNKLMKKNTKKITSGKAGEMRTFIVLMEYLLSVLCNAFFPGNKFWFCLFSFLFVCLFCCYFFLGEVEWCSLLLYIHVTRFHSYLVWIWNWYFHDFPGPSLESMQCLNLSHGYC